MASKFPPFLASAVRDYEMYDFVVDSAQTFGAHSLVFFNTSDREIELCGADPALILGIATGPASVALGTTKLYDRLPVIVLTPNTLVGLSSPTTPAETNVGEDYGLVRDSGTGFWQLDTTDTTNVRVFVNRVDITNGIFYCNFLAANLQFDAIAS